jgi:hypothetical protein
VWAVFTALKTRYSPGIGQEGVHAKVLAHIAGDSLLVGLFMAKTGTQEAWWLVAVGLVLAGPFTIDEDRRQRAAKKLADANRITPINTSSWVDAAMVIGGGLLMLAAMITGFGLEERWPSHSLFAFAGFILGMIGLIGAIWWAGKRERKRKQAIPPGLIGQAADGVYVYDSDALKDQSRQRPQN